MKSPAEFLADGNWKQPGDNSMFDCTQCGACCLDQLIILRETDIHVPPMMRDGFFMRKQGGRCVALSGKLGVNAKCTIYNNRPEICRFMKPGCEPCLNMRQEWGLS